jgi:transcriptional regulator with XRE-family HTH domain
MPQTVIRRAKMKFKDTLRGLRLKAGLTQETLAQKAGIPLGSLRGHEQGQRIPSWASVVRLARALDVSTDAFSHCEEVSARATSGRKSSHKKN